MKKNNYSNMTAIAVNKSLVKEYQTTYGRTVYLDKDSEFQIKLFNPTTETIGADIIINGKSLGEKLVIKPGQLIWLERDFAEARKFRFDVYEVDAQVQAVQEAIRNNGDVQIKFYKEKPKQNFAVWRSNAPGYNGYTGNYTYNSASNIKYKGFSGNTSITDMVNTMQLTPSSYDVIGSTIDSNLTFGLNDLRSATSEQLAATRGIDKGINISARLNMLKTETMETGRVDRGSYSNQRFMEVDIDFEYYPFATEEIKLLPKSQKPVFKEDLQKLYCTQCGRKVKPKFKYCPFCGGKL